MYGKPTSETFPINSNLLRSIQSLFTFTHSQMCIQLSYRTENFFSAFELLILFLFSFCCCCVQSHARFAFIVADALMSTNELRVLKISEMLLSGWLSELAFQRPTNEARETIKWSEFAKFHWRSRLSRDFPPASRMSYSGKQIFSLRAAWRGKITFRVKNRRSKTFFYFSFIVDFFIFFCVSRKRNETSALEVDVQLHVRRNIGEGSLEWLRLWILWNWVALSEKIQSATVMARRRERSDFVSTLVELRLG